MTKRAYKKGSESDEGRDWAEFLALHASSLSHFVHTQLPERNYCLSLAFGRLLAALNQQKVLTQKCVLEIVGVDAYRDMQGMEIRNDPGLTRHQALHFLKKRRECDDELIKILDRAGVYDLPSLVRERDQLKQELDETKNQRILILHLFRDKELVAVLLSKNKKAKIGWVAIDFQKALTHYVTRGIEFPREHPCEHLNISATASSESLIRNIAKLYAKTYKFRTAEIIA